MRKTRHHEHKDRTIWLMYLAIAVLLITGMLISVIQIQQRNNIRSEGTTGGIINCSVDNAKLQISMEEQGLFDEINKHRQQYGLATLVWSDTLVRAATWMSEDMLKSKSLNHIDSLGRDMANRLTDCGYRSYSSIGENIDSGTPDYKTTFEAWKHSPPHNANMLNPNFTEVGIALASNQGNNSYYWTLDLGTKSNPSPTSVIPTPTLTPVITINPSNKPSNSPTTYITKNPSPSIQVPTITLTIAPTKKVTPAPTPIISYPALKSVDPDPAYSNSIIIVEGTGGYKKYWDGYIYDTNINFQLYIDGIPIGIITCNSRNCKGEIKLRNIAIGDHILSVEGGSKLSLKVRGAIPTGVPTPTVTPVPTTPPDYKPNPHDMQLFITAKITGIGFNGNHNPKHQTKHVTVGIYDMDNKLVTEGNGFIIYDKLNLFRGVIHFGPVDYGTYFIKILSEHMLRETVLPTFQILDPTRLNIMPQVTLLQGDVNDDNVIDINDYNIALVCFRDNKCEDKTLIDFSDDGVADIVDYNILLHNYWESQGD